MNAPAPSSIRPTTPDRTGKLEPVDMDSQVLSSLIGGQTEILKHISERRSLDETLERVVVETIESGDMTKDLALLVGPDQRWRTTMGLLEKVDANLDTALGG